MSGIATAIVGTAVVGGIMSSNATKDAAETAADAQTTAAEASVAESRYQFDQVQALLAPYSEAGTSALSQQQALLGLSGYEAQDDAINALKNSSQYDQLMSASEESILQNQSATGGVRGGDTKSALMQNAPNVLNQLIESQYSKLGNLSSLGQASAAGTAAAAQNTGTAVSDALTASGNAQAQSALAQGQATSNMWGDISGAVGTYAGTL